MSKNTPEFEDWLAAQSTRLEAAWQADSVQALLCIINLCKQYQRPAPAWADDALAALLQAVLRPTAKGKRWFARLRKTERLMRVHFARWDTVCELLERWDATREILLEYQESEAKAGREYQLPTSQTRDATYIAVSEVLKGTPARGSAEAIKQAASSLSAR